MEIGLKFEAARSNEGGRDHAITHDVVFSLS